jgi:hypothetical protein
MHLQVLGDDSPSEIAGSPTARTDGTLDGYVTP